MLSEFRDNNNLTGKVALVTGGGRGIGRTIALALAEQGADVAVGARTKKEIEKTSREIERSTGANSVAAPLDVTDYSSIQKAIRKTRSSLGGFHILVNSAGVTDKDHRRLEDLPIEKWKQVIEVNLTGTFKCCKAALPYFHEQDYGNIINISSLLGQPGEAQIGDAAYSSSKFGIEGLSEVLAKESNTSGVIVNTLFPAAKVDTGFFDYLPQEERENLEDPEIMKEPAVVLASQEPGGLTGQSVNAKKWLESEAYREHLLKKS